MSNWSPLNFEQIQSDFKEMIGTLLILPNCVFQCYFLNTKWLTMPNFTLHKKSKEKGDSAIPTCLTLIKDHYLLTIWALYSVSNMDFSFPCVPLCQFVFVSDICTFHQCMETCNISNVGKLQQLVVHFVMKMLKGLIFHLSREKDVELINSILQCLRWICLHSGSFSCQWQVTPHRLQ